MQPKGGELMLNYLEQHWRKFVNVGLLATLLITLFYLLKLSFEYALCVYVALFFYAIYRPGINFWLKRGFSYTVSATLSVVISLITMVTTLSSIGVVLFLQAQAVFLSLPQMFITLKDWCLDLFYASKDHLQMIPDSVFTSIIEHLGKAASMLGDWFTNFFATVFTNVSAIASVSFQAMIGFILSIFLAYEWPVIISSIKKLFSTETKTMVVTVFGDTIRAFASYIKAQVILVTSTFLLVWGAFSLIDVKNALFMAFVCAVLDVLPIVGATTLFIPWIIFVFTIGNIALGIKLTILWIGVLVFRQSIEPRLTGGSLGISPFVMLAGMTTFATMWGVIGIFLAPIILAVSKSLWTKGYLHLWILGERDKRLSQTRLDI